MRQAEQRAVFILSVFAMLAFYDRSELMLLRVEGAEIAGRAISVQQLRADLDAGVELAGQLFEGFV